MASSTLLLPAAGSATRISGLPKFALPIGPHATPLIKTHVEAASANGVRVVVGTRPIWRDLFENILLDTQVEIVYLETKTGAETLLALLSTLKETNSYCITSLPDTYIPTLTSDIELLLSRHSQPAGQSTERLVEALTVTYRSRIDQLGKLGTCLTRGERLVGVFDKTIVDGGESHWGIIGAEQGTWTNFLTNSDPHAGALLSSLLIRKATVGVVEAVGPYYDCGTVHEYSEALRWSLNE